MAATTRRPLAFGRAGWRYSLRRRKRRNHVRCRLVASWGRSRSQGLGCSPIKAVRELGLERRSLRPHGAIRGCPPAHIGETLTCHTRTVRLGQYRGKASIDMQASTASYIAGFLDGDGSIHFQLVRQKEYRFGYYIRASLSFSQSTSAKAGLEHLQRLLGGGYLRDRGTGMSDLVITSRPLLISILTEVEQHAVFKRKHISKALLLLSQIRPRPSPEEFLRLAHEVDAFASLNYSKTKRITAADVERHLRSKGLLAPVTTSSFRKRWDSLPNGKSMDPITRRPLERG